MTFDEALTFVLAWEGGYSDDPRDKGGATKHGITIGTLEVWRGRPQTPADVAALTLDEAKRIYLARFWTPLRCSELPPGLDLMLFDSGVNCGPGRAVEFLQRAADVTVDGLFGPKTMAAVEASDVRNTIQEVAARRAVHYCRLQSAFHLGWLRRSFDCYRAALEAAS